MASVQNGADLYKKRFSYKCLVQNLWRHLFKYYDGTAASSLSTAEPSI